VTTTTIGILLAVAAYFAGSFPTASIVGLLSGHDHNREGSGNPGASNVWRTSGATYGMITVTADALKGVLPVLATLLLSNRTWAAVAWIAATVGHIVPFGRFRRGGKGVATGGGGSLPLFPVLGLAMIAVFVVIVKLTRKASLASLVITALLLVGVILLHEETIEIVAAVTVATLVILRHWSNIGRLISGDELSVR